VGWPPPPPLRRAPLRWFRARFLYALDPADGNLFKYLAHSDWFALFVTALKAVPFCGVNVMVQALTFAMIDKADEFQLVNFVLQFKGFQFLAALFAAAKLGLAALFVFVDSAGHTMSSAEMAALAPGQAGDFPLAVSLEPLRVLLTYVCLLLLWCGATHGGKAEVHALEQVRILARDDASALNAVELSRQHADALRAARAQLGARVARGGGYLPLFLCFDALISVAVGAATVHAIVQSGWGSSDWIFWTVLYYAKMVYGLLSFPFLLFVTPMVGPALHRARATAYNEEGRLVPKLSDSLIKDKIREDAESGKSKKEKKIWFQRSLGSRSASSVQHEELL